MSGGLHVWRLRVWRFTGMTIHEPEDSLVTQRAFQMHDKAQGLEGRFMLMVVRFKRKGTKNILTYKELRPGLVSGLYSKVD